MTPSSLKDALFILIIGLVCFACKRENPNPVDQATREITQHLVDRINPDGSFTFKVFADNSIPNPTHENILWHAAALEYLANRRISSQVNISREHLIKTSSHLKKKGVSRAGICSNCMGVWIHSYSPAKEKNVRKVKLGAVGIALAALVEMESTQPATTSREALSGLANFIKNMELESGGLAAQYAPHQSDSIYGKAPLRFAGMAAYGLLKYYEFTQDKSWLDFAYRILNHYAAENIRYDRPNIDNWISLAYLSFIKAQKSAAKLQPYNLRGIKEDVHRMTKLILDMQILEDPKSSFYGSFDRQGLTYKSAARASVLAYSYWILKDEMALKAKIVRALEAGVSFILRAQIKEGKHKGGMPRAIMRIPSASSFFNMKQSEIRLDYLILSLQFLDEYQSVMADAKNLG